MLKILFKRKNSCEIYKSYVKLNSHEIFFVIYKENCNIILRFIFKLIIR